MKKLKRKSKPANKKTNMSNQENWESNTFGDIIAKAILMTLLILGLSIFLDRWEWIKLTTKSYWANASIVVGIVIWVILESNGFIRQARKIARRSSEARLIEACSDMLFKIVWIILVFSFGYQAFGVTCNDIVTSDIEDTLYFSFVTWTTLGYGDCSPSSLSKILAVFQAMLGFVLNAIFAGSVVAVFLRGST